MRDVGVVDPIRAPDWARALYRETPVTARIFIGLAALDVALRLLRLLQPAIDLTVTDPLSIVTTVIPRDLWILLPAVLVVRRPDAATATPLILGGAIVLAVTELVRVQLEAWLGAANIVTDGGVGLWVAAIANLAVMTGDLAIARGLGRLTPHEPTDAVAGIANLVAFGVLLAILLELVNWAATGVPFTGFGEAADRAILVGAGVGMLGTVAWAALLRSVVRGLGDSRRSELAAVLGSTAAALVAVMSAVVAVVGIVGFVLGHDQALDQSISTIDTWTEFVLGPAFLVLAFALGLGDPPYPYVMARTEGAPPRAGEPPAPEPRANEPRAGEPQAPEPSGDTSAA